MRTQTRLLPAALALVAFGCTRDTSGLDPAPTPAQGVVFTDAFGDGVGFQGFSGSSTAALAIDSTVRHTGIASLRINVPLPTDPTGSYAGGAFVAEGARDLSGYDALTFWARASIDATLNVAGLGNDNTGTSRYTAQRADIPLTTSWQKVVIPIPLPSRLASERGLFFLAEGAENGAAYQIWLDDVRFEKLGTVTNPRPAMPSRSVSQEVGGVTRVDGLSVTFAVDGVDQVVSAMPSYFTFSSSNTNVATTAADGAITIVGAGDATITAALGAVPATGEVTVHTLGAPAAAAPAPTRAAADVLSLFSDAYQNAAVSTWSASWDQADVADVQVGGNAAKKYTNLVFAGIELAQPLDASAMTHLHLDAYVLNDDAFKIKLVDFGANGAYGGGDDTEHELTLGRASTPAVTKETWSSLDIPLAAFTGLAARAHIAQVVLAGSSGTVYLDNIYFYKEAVVVPPSEPTTAAPAPTWAAGDVVSLYSDAYANRTVDTWSASWDQADLADVTVAGNATKKYTNLVFAGIEFTTQTIDASAMTHFHMQIWTPDATTNAAFKIKLVDFGANGVWNGGGDDVEHEITLDAASTPALRTGQWLTLDIPLSRFTGLTTRGHLAQLIISGDPKTVFVDNVLLHR